MNESVIMIGAGGHAKVCIEEYQAIGGTVDFCIGNVDSQKTCLGVPVLHGDDNIAHLSSTYKYAFVAVGDNHLRGQLALYLRASGYTLINIISRNAFVSPTAFLGNGVLVMPGAVINSGVSLSDLVIVNSGAIVEHDCKVGHACHLGPRSAIGGGVNLGERVFLGIGAIVLPMVIIGNDSTLGAGAVAIHDLPGDATYIGVPARLIKKSTTSL